MTDPKVSLRADYVAGSPPARRVLGTDCAVRPDAWEWRVNAASAQPARGTMTFVRFGSIVAFIVLIRWSGADAQVRTPIQKLPYPRLDTSLARMVTAIEAGEPRGAALARLANPLMESEMIPVAIRARDVAAVTAWLQRVGARVANSGPDVIEAYVSPTILRDLSSLAGVIRVSQIVPAEERVVSQGVAVHNAGNWQANGYPGSGVKVGIIDTGFAGLSLLMGTELPAAVTARCYSAMGLYSADLGACQTGSSHGTGVAESLVDVAPGVQLFIANPKSNLDFRQTIEWLTSQGVRVINFSVATLWDGAGDGTSPYSDSPLRAVDLAVSAGAVFVTSAGNEGQSTYFGSFVDSNGDSWAEFPAGMEDNAVFLHAGERITIQLRWQDTWGSSARDLDLYLYDVSYLPVAYSIDTQNSSAGSTPFEYLTYTASTTGTYYIGVKRYAGATPGWIQLQNFSSQGLAYSTPSGSIGNPAETANSGALAVGAAPWYSPGTLEVFSSRGPTPDGRLKPDLVGVDRGDTATYGAFAGTSQASPHVAGLAAIVLQRFPALSSAQVAAYLKAVAAPGSGPRPNNDWGYGLPILPGICTYSLSLTSMVVPPWGGSGSVSVTTAPGCAWTAVSDAGFVTMTSNATGSGPGNIAFSVATNPSSASRVATLTIGGAILAINQAGRRVDADFDGDGRADITVFRPSNGTWYTRYSGGGTGGFQWGNASDVPAAADYDGDGRLDVAVFRPSDGVWYLWYSSTATAFGLQWGNGLDRPVPADYDGDGKADVAVFRPSDGVWYIRYSTGGGTGIQWGNHLDVAVPADYDGDGRADIAVFRPSDGTWYIRYSTGGSYAFQWGNHLDVTVPGDYDGDRAADVAVFRPSDGVWYIRYSSTGSLGGFQWGNGSDKPVPADYDGDGKTDFAVFRPSDGIWYLWYSSTNSAAGFQWGNANDVPIPKRP